MGPWCRRCGGPLERGGCASCGPRTFDERQADAARDRAAQVAAREAFVRTQVGEDVPPTFDALLDHLLPTRETTRRELRYARRAGAWRLELWVDGALTLDREVPPPVDVALGTLLQLRSSGEPEAPVLSSLAGLEVRRVAGGFVVVRDA